MPETSRAVPRAAPAYQTGLPQGEPYIENTGVYPELAADYP
jgi:hypothetical protein